MSLSSSCYCEFRKKKKTILKHLERKSPIYKDFSFTTSFVATRLLFNQLKLHIKRCHLALHGDILFALVFSRIGVGGTGIFAMYLQLAC